MSRVYFDSTYLVKLYCREQGSEEVRKAAGNHVTIVSSLHARSELAATFHRKVREGSITRQNIRAPQQQFLNECNEGSILLLPLRDALFARIEDVFLNAPETLFLRSADAVHLACAAENGFSEVYSNDRHLLAAAPLFGLRGVNVIPE